MNQNRGSPLGKVYLVGAGPGDPGLITMRGAECLAKADLIIYDCLTNPVLLEYAPPDAEAVCIGEQGAQDCRRTVPRNEIGQLLVDTTRKGGTAVHLKGGDPMVFGQTAEEIEVLAAAGIPHEIVPGVTAAVAAAGYAAIPITHGQHCSAVALVTGQERGGKSGEPLNYAALADFPGTLIFYMADNSAENWSRALIRGGKSAETPVAIVCRVSWNDQQTIRCTLGTVAEVISRSSTHAPAVIIIGEVVSLAAGICWFTSRPLFGTRILLTRPREQARSLSARLAELGAEVLLQPAIEISEPEDWSPVDAALEKLDGYDWLVFSSVNGVRYLLDRLCHRHGDLRRLGGVKLAAIGPGTADELTRYHLRADLVPRQYHAEALAEELIQACCPGPPDAAPTQHGPTRFLLARASRGREILAERLSAPGGYVDQIVVYTSMDVRVPGEEAATAVAEGRIDWVTVTSSAIARSLHRLFGPKLQQTHLASISPVTSETLRQLGYRPTVEATRYTMDGLVDAIVRHAEEP